MSSAIAVTDLSKSYNGLQALRGISFEIAEGEIFGLLGPNGAGKTTTVEILEGYRERDGGAVTVLGEDPSTAGLPWRERIGVVLQSSSFYDSLTVAENLALFAGYYTKPRAVGEVVELVGLEEKRDALVRNLSGGQRRRLDLGSRSSGTRSSSSSTSRPRLRPRGSPARVADDRIAPRPRQDDPAHDALPRGGRAPLGPGCSPAERRDRRSRPAVGADVHPPATEIRYRRNGQEVVMQTEEPTKLLHDLTREALAAGHELEGLEVRRASLEDVYLSLTKEEEYE